MRLFVSDQRWIYAIGPTLPDALHRLADALTTENAFSIPSDHYYDLESNFESTVIEVRYSDDPEDDDSFYRAGICVSWKPGT